jgi:hypothetical protein
MAIGGTLYLWQDNGGTQPPQWLSAHQTVSTVALSPNFAQDCTIYAGMGPGKQVLGYTIQDGLYMSTNACPANLARHADTWTWLRNGLTIGGQMVSDVTSIMISPNYATDHTVFIGSASRGVFESADAGKSWTQINNGLVNNGLGNLAVNQLTLSPAGDTGTVFAATQAGVWETRAPLGSVPPRPGRGL